MTVPQRFQAPCEFCGETLDIRRKGRVFQLQTGWMLHRSQGGGNALALRRPVEPFQYACLDCIDRERAGAARWQLDLFG